MSKRNSSGGSGCGWFLLLVVTLAMVLGVGLSLDGIADLLTGGSPAANVGQSNVTIVLFVVCVVGLLVAGKQGR